MAYSFNFQFLTVEMRVQTYNLKRVCLMFNLIFFLSNFFHFLTHLRLMFTPYRNLSIDLQCILTTLSFNWLKYLKMRFKYIYITPTTWKLPILVVFCLPVFSGIWTKYGDLQTKYPYSDQMRENKYQKKKTLILYTRPSVQNSDEN